MENKKEYIIIGSVGVNDRPNTEVFFNSKDKEETKKVYDLINQFIEFQHEENQEKMKKGLDKLEDYSVSFYNDPQIGIGDMPKVQLLGIFESKRIEEEQDNLTQIKELLKSKGYKVVSQGSLGGNDNIAFLDKDLNFISVKTEDLDIDVIADYLGVNLSELNIIAKEQEAHLKKVWGALE